MLLVVILSLLCALVIGACLLARHNVRLGRADWRSAFRLSGFLFALGMASWALATHHMASARELIIFMMGLSINLLAAASDLGSLRRTGTVCAAALAANHNLVDAGSERAAARSGSWRAPVGGHFFRSILRASQPRSRRL